MFLNKFPSVIMLHHVTDDPTLDKLKPYSISRASFTRLLDVLEEEQYTTTNFHTLNKKGKNVILSFDDCPRHLWDFAIPELKARSMTASFYMPTAYINGKNDWDIAQGKPAVELMNDSELKNLTEIGMEVGSHSHEHVELATLEEDKVRQNLKESKLILEGITSSKIVSVAYPFGSIPKNNKALLKEMGFDYGLSIFTPYESRYDIRRWIYHDGDDTNRIKKKLSLTYKAVRTFTDKMK